MDCTILDFWLETVTQFCDGHKMENYEYIHFTVIQSAN